MKWEVRSRKWEGKRKASGLHASYFILFTSYFLLLTSYLGAKPWYGRDKEFQWETSLAYQRYDHLHSGLGKISYPSDDFFLDTSVAIAIDESWNVGLEVLGAHTRQSCFRFDSVSLMGQYALLNDVVGDPVSLTLGVNTTFVTQQGLRDITVGHHGEYEVEALVSVGKETPCGPFWSSRWWGTAGLGLANRGSPWSCAYLAWEKNFCDQHQWRLFAEGRWGFGEGDLSLVLPFRGYGHIQHRSADIGIRYSIFLLCLGTFSVEYAYRVYARNFPAHTNRVAVSFLYPFGL